MHQPAGQITPTARSSDTFDHVQDKPRLMQLANAHSFAATSLSTQLYLWMWLSGATKGYVWLEGQGACLVCIAVLVTSTKALETFCQFHVSTLAMLLICGFIHGLTGVQ